MNKTSFFEPPRYNLHGRQQLWVESCIQSHDSWCGCNHPAIHLLSCLLPPGHKDRETTIEVLIQKAYNTKWHSGGTGEKDTTADLTEATTEQKDLENLEDVFGDNAIDELLVAAAEDATPR